MGLFFDELKFPLRSTGSFQREGVFRHTVKAQEGIEQRSRIPVTAGIDGACARFINGVKRLIIALDRFPARSPPGAVAPALFALHPRVAA